MGKNFWAKLKKGFKSLISFCKKTHREGPFKVHKKLHKFNWYAAWHKHPHHKKIHAAILVIYVLSILASSFLLPTQTQAALTTRTITKSSLAEFAQGTLDDLLNENDALSMHLGKKVNTGNSTSKDDLNSYSGRSVTRTSDGKIHIVWIKKEVAPKIIYASSSVDEGSTWEIPQEVATDQNATGVLVKVDGSNNVHIFWAVADPGKNYIRHRVRGADTFFGAIRTIPTNEMDGAVADWQAIPQGDHYGNYYDTVTGGLATVTRTTPKTIYDSATGRVHDVPAGYLGVRPYSNSQPGGLGYEAVVEEQRTNYLLTSSFETDTNADGLADNWLQFNGAQGTFTQSLTTSQTVHSTKAQSIRAVGLAGATAAGILSESTAVGSFAAGETAVFSTFLRGVEATGCAIRIQIAARDAADAIISSVSTGDIAVGASLNQVSVTYSNLPANTSRVRAYVFFNSFNENDVGEFIVDAAQIEKGAFGTSYIPTTTATATRNADVISIPTTGWDVNQGTFSMVRGAQIGTYDRVLDWYVNDNNRLSLSHQGNSTWMWDKINGVNNYANITNPVGTHVFAGRWEVGQPLAAYSNGVKGSGTQNTYEIPIGLSGVTTARLGGGPGVNNNNYANASIHRFIVYTTPLSDADVTANYNAVVNGTEEAIIRNPAADWQAVLQGDHYGNFRDSVTGGLATITRTTPKTIYDSTTNKIYDVPAGYLGVRPRTDGKPGYEAEIEEARTNYALTSYFNTDGNSDGIPDSWSVSSTTTNTPTYTLIDNGPYGKWWRVQYTAVAGDSTNKSITLSSNSESATFSPGDNLTASIYYKGTMTGTTPKVWASARTEALVNLGDVGSAGFTTQTTPTRASVTLSNMPATTARAGTKIAIEDIMDGDSLDLYISASQMEKGTFPTSYIPTTTTRVTRNYDSVTVPNNDINMSAATLLVDAAIPWETTGLGQKAFLYSNNDFQIYRGNTARNITTNYVAFGGGGVYTSTANVDQPSWSHALVGARWGNGIVQTYQSEDGFSASQNININLDINASIGIGAAGSNVYTVNGFISRFVGFPASLTNSNVSRLSTQINSTVVVQKSDFANPSVDSSNNVHYAYNKGGGTGIGYRMWNGSSWTQPNVGAVVAGVGDHTNQNTLSIGNNLYYFYTLTSDGKRYFVRRIDGNWISPPTLVSDFNSADSSEIVDSDGNIYIFTTDESLSDNVIKYRKYTVAGNSFGSWATLDSQASTDVRNPSATISSNGNIWTYYSIGNEIFYKVFNKSTGFWGSRTQYTFNNPLGTPWKDLSGNGKDGTLTNFNGNSTSGWLGSGTDADPFKLKFDGTNDSVDFGNYPIFDFTNNLSLETWVKTSQATYGGIISKRNVSGVSYGYDLGVYNNKATFNIRSGANGNSPDVQNNTNISDNQWHHVVANFDGSQIRIYVDGVSNTPVSWSFPSSPSTSNLLLGSRSGSTYFNGELTQVRAYNRPLTQQEITQNFNQGKNGVSGHITDGLIVNIIASKATVISSYLEGVTTYPKVRYQENFHNQPDKIDLTYRQNPTGDTSSYNLYYGTVGSDTTGVYTSPESGDNVLTTNWIGGWANPALSSNVNIQDSTSIKYELRSGNGPNNTTISWGNWVEIGTVNSSTGTGNRLYTVADSAMPNQSQLPIGTEKYIQARISLISENGTNVPTLFDYSLNYLADENDPVWLYPAAVPAYTDDTKTTPITSGVWDGHNTGNSVYFDWAGASDGVGESGISDYYVYFGTDNTANPITAGTDKNLVTEGLLTIATPISGQTYYLRVSVCDVAGNCLDEPSGESLFTFRFDNEKPIAPTNYSVSPVGWSTTNNFSFSWDAATDPGSGASEIKGYEYKRAGGGDSWTYIDAAPTITISNKTAYQDGANDFYIRSVDNAGNNSGDTTNDWAVVHYYYNGTAPSKPLNVVVEPQQSNTNSFTFTWDEPQNHNSDIKGYYYSINEEPTLTNSVYTTSTTTGAIPAATKQGLNKFYVAAVDVANDTLLGEVSDEVVFECNTTAPGIPGGVVISDSSNMAASDWALTTKWQVPGTGTVDHYNIYRSTNGNNYSKIAQTTSTGYLDSGLSNTSTYFYKITAVDNAGAESGYSSVVSKQPTGKFTQPPIILDGPDVSAKATNTTITWTTDRPSSSFVSFGKSENNLNDSKGQLDNVTSHSVTLWGLDPGTTYYYKVQSFDENRDYPTGDALSNGYSFKTQAAPAIEDVKVDDVGLYSAVVTWKTTSSATSKIVYGKTGKFDRVIEDKSGSQTTIHTVQLEGLDHSSSYNYKIMGTDVDENKLESDNYFFETLVYPKVSNVRFEQQKNTATATLKVVWDSNVPLTSVAEYKLSSGGTFKEVSSSKLLQKHEMLIPGLKDNTDYLIQVQGRDAHGNLATSDLNKVRTDFDTRPPSISDITTETSIVGFGKDAKSQVILSWETDEPATSQVLYEIGTGGENDSNKTQADDTLSTTHVVVISGLKPSTVYHFHAVSADGSGNETTSEETSVLTEQASSSVLDMIINSLESSLGWLFKVMNR